MNFLNQAELGVLDWIQTYMRCPFLDKVFPVITALGDAGILWIALAAVLLVFKKTRKTGLMMGVALATGLILVNGCMKPLVGRIRPFDVQAAVALLIEKPHDYSFPSGHTLACFEAATVLLIRHKKWGIPALIMAILISFSRMYLYVHYPTDIIAGVILGILIALFAVWVVDKIHNLLRKKNGQIKSEI